MLEFQHSLYTHSKCLRTLSQSDEPQSRAHVGISATSLQRATCCAWVGAVGSEGPALAQDDDAAAIVQDAASDTATVLEDTKEGHTLALLPSHTSQ